MVSATLQEIYAVHRNPLIIDARPPGASDRYHSSVALPLSPERWESDFPNVVAAWHPDSTLVVIGNGSRSDPSRVVARRLVRELGAQKVLVLTHGGPAFSTPTR